MSFVCSEKPLGGRFLAVTSLVLGPGTELAFHYSRLAAVARNSIGTGNSIDCARRGWPCYRFRGGGQGCTFGTCSESVAVGRPRVRGIRNGTGDRLATGGVDADTDWQPGGSFLIPMECIASARGDPAMASDTPSPCKTLTKISSIFRCLALMR